MEELRTDSGIVVDCCEVTNQNYQYAFYYENVKENESIEQRSLIDLINYINPTNRMSDREVIMSVIEYLLCIDNELFDRFKSNTLLLNNLTRTCTMSVMNKFEEFGLMVHNLNRSIDEQLDEDQVNHATFYTFLFTLRMLLNRHVQRGVLQVDEAIKLESVEFKSLWHFYEYLNSHHCDHMIDKVYLLNSINLKVNQPTSNKIENYHKLVSILDQLYLNLSFPTEQNRYLWILFFNCLKPTLKYLQDFLINGYPSDVHNEFYFENVNYQYESDFWSTCLVMRDWNRIPICLKKCWKKVVNGLKSRLLMRYAEEQFNFESFSLYDEFLDDLLVSFGIEKKGDDQSINEPLTSNAFSYDYLNQINNEVSLLFSSVESIDKTSNHTFSSSLESVLDDSDLNDDLNKNLETQLRKQLNALNDQINRYENVNLELVEFKKQFDLKELNLASEDEHEFDRFLLSAECPMKQIKFYFDDSLKRSLDKIITPISQQVSELFKKDYLNNLKFFNDYYLMQLEQHSFSLFFDTLFEKLIYDPIGFQENLYSKVYDLPDFGFENTNLVIFLEFSETFDDDLIYFDIISRLNLLYKDLDWTSSTIINNDAQDFFNRSCKVLMKIKFIKWLTNNLPTLNRDFNHQRHRKLPFYNLFHKLFLIKHNLTILLETLHSAVLIKINSLQPELYSQTANGSNYEQLADSFQQYLQQLAIILHLDFHEQNEDKSLFHGFIRRLCEKAIDLWKIWFSIEELFYLKFDESNIHCQLNKRLSDEKNGAKTMKVVKKVVRKNDLKVGRRNDRSNSNMRTNGSLLPRMDLSSCTRSIVSKNVDHVKRWKCMNGMMQGVNDAKNSKDNQSKEEINQPKCPGHFDTIVDVNEINAKLDEISGFLKTNAEIFIQI